jgi:glycosyltransferase involved in cell wall biosynthesis
MESGYMKIAIDARGVNWYSGTGIGTYTSQLIKYMIKNDETNLYHLYWWGKDYNKFSDTQNVTVSIASKKHHKFFEEYYIPENIKNKAIDIYHVPQNGIGLSSSKNCIYISTIHDLIPYVMPETVGRGYLRKFISTMPKIIESSDMIITVSEFSKKDIVRIFDVDPDRIKVTSLAADSCFRPIEKDTAKEFIKEKYNIENDFILYLGGFSPRKNVKSILVAFSRMSREIRDDLRIVIIGPSKDEHYYLSGLCEDLNIKDKVIFTGYVQYTDLPYFYNASNAFVYPSLYEGFGLPPLEAMSCRVPVITSNVSSIPEVVKDGAILINPFDAEDLKSALENVIEDDALSNAIADKGYSISKNFTWDKTALKTLEIYKEAFEAHRAG